MTTESPTPHDVFAHLASNQNTLEHWLKVITSMPADQFDGNQILSATSHDLHWVDFVDDKTMDPRELLADAPRCFIGHSIVAAPEAFNEYMGQACKFTARVFNIPLAVVQHIYIGVMEMRFDQACEFATETVQNYLAGKPAPRPSRWVSWRHDKDDEQAYFEEFDRVPLAMEA